MDTTNYGNQVDRQTGVQIVGSGRARAVHSPIELENFVTAKTVEEAYRWASETMRNGDAEGHKLAARGLDAAKRRHPKLLLALEKGAEVVHQMAESQRGRTARDTSGTVSERVWPTEAQLWREAYVTCDRGTVVEELAWIYAAGARLAGLI